MRIAAYSGHAPGHVRKTFQDAFFAMLDWRGEGPVPMVQFEVDYQPELISIDEACTLVSRCSDIMPGMMVDELAEYGGLKSRTYAAGAQAMRRWLKSWQS
ncbi:hypothetical protein [Bradyrhizobium guangdongense]|nr:hypothetical protein [Bradyrhizobium guangdongense]GGI24157.1 hypothetical protein GCM10010987_27980 [Bradyrhizobium guangdongense]